MKIYSASEAVWPALLRTYSYLFRPFKWETFLKLATIATLCEGLLVSFKFVVPNTFPFDFDMAVSKSFLFAPEFLAVTILGAMALLVMAIYAFFLLTQLRFAFFHSLIHQTRAFRKTAKLYTAESERFFMGSALVWLTFLVFAVLFVVLVIVAAYTVLNTRTPEGKLDPGHFLFLFFPCLGVFAVLVLAVCAAQVVLNDFILPHMAIEGVSFNKAWAEARARMAANKETFMSFFILRLAMPLVAGVLLALAAWLTGIVIFSLLGMSTAGFDAMLDGIGGFRAILLSAIHVLFFLLGLAAGWVVAVTFSGPLCVFMRAYALYFYGGYYKALGNLLEPQVPQAVLAEAKTAPPAP
ncbi:MAG: hypothetical protein ABSF53_18515 [Terracidiphilus sp.]|jgi:hypothetical protein